MRDGAARRGRRLRKNNTAEPRCWSGHQHHPRRAGVATTNVIAAQVRYAASAVRAILRPLPWLPGPPKVGTAPRPRRRQSSAWQHRVPPSIDSNPRHHQPIRAMVSCGKWSVKLRRRSQPIGRHCCRIGADPQRFTNKLISELAQLECGVGIGTGISKPKALPCLGLEIIGVLHDRHGTRVYRSASPLRWRTLSGSISWAVASPASMAMAQASISKAIASRPRNVAVLSLIPATSSRHCAAFCRKNSAECSMPHPCPPIL